MQVDFFAGNFKSGKITAKSLYFASKSEAESVWESVIDELLTIVGWEHGIWATYSDGKSHEEHARNFDQFIHHHMVTSAS